MAHTDFNILLMFVQGTDIGAHEIYVQIYAQILLYSSLVVFYWDLIAYWLDIYGQNLI